jgi:hypothetical protein
MDDAALRIASALEACSSTAAVAFSVSASQGESFASTGVELKTRARAIHKRVPGGELQKILDIYEFNYAELLISDHAKSSPVVKSIRLLIQVLLNVPRLFMTFASKAQKSFREKIQLVYATVILLMLTLYFFFLVAAVGSTVHRGIHQFVPPQDKGHQQSIFPPPPSGENKRPAEKDDNHLLWITYFAGGISSAVVIYIAALEAFLPGLKAGFLDASARYTSLLEYISLGARGSVLEGQLYSLLDHVQARQYRKIHIVAYSFGSVLALDSFFPAGRLPGKRIGNVQTLITIGCPFDMIRTFWPEYYEHRFALPGPMVDWINVYSPLDVLGSNFRADSKIDDPDPGQAIPFGNASEMLLLPRVSLAWTTAKAMNRISWMELLFLVGLRAHNSYWECRYESEYTSFSPIISELYNDSPILG